jgi:ribosome-associated heat shock protein Hsp15
MSGTNEIRIDKFLWAVRLFKTRSLATEACKKGKVSIAGNAVKPSRIINAGDVITVRMMPVIYTYRILIPLENRVAAKLVGQYLEDLTPEEEKARLLAARMPGAFGIRDRGMGRPTKKERRIIDGLFDNLSGE